MDRYNRTNIRAALKEKNIRIKKRYGQNFLTDRNMLEKIAAEAGLDKETGVIEIGPGLGSLTAQLTRRAAHVLAYEIDDQFIDTLRETFSLETVTFIHGDVLKQNLDADIEKHLSHVASIAVVANLPYYVTTPIIMKCLEETDKIDRMIVLVQLEVARRLTASPKTKEYNALSVAIRYRTHARFAFKVPRQLFMPTPDVESAVIVLETKREEKLDKPLETYFFRLIKAAFRHRRKTLLNNLITFSDLDRETLADVVSRTGLHPDIRAEALNLDDFVRLARMLYTP